MAIKQNVVRIMPLGVLRGFQMEGLESMIATAQELGTRFGLNIIAAIVIFIVGGWAAKIIRRII